MRKPIVLSFSLLIFLATVLFPQAPVSAKSSSAKVTILKEWRFMDDRNKETMSFSETSFHCWIGGPGLPVEGLDLKKKIAAITPSPRSRNGMIVVGPDEITQRPYWVIHWRGLRADRVKLYIDQKSFPSVENARRESKIDMKKLKNYRAIR